MCSVRTYLSLQCYPKLVFLYFLAFHLYLLKNPNGFTYVALYATYCFVLHLMLYFFNHSEIPAYESGLITALRPRHPFAGEAGADDPETGSARAADTNAPPPASVLPAVTVDVTAASHNSSPFPSPSPSPSPRGGECMDASSESILTEEHRLTLGRVEYFTTDALTTPDDPCTNRVLGGGEGGDCRRLLRPARRSFSTPLDEIIAFEQAVYLRRQCGSRTPLSRSAHSSHASLAALDGGGKDDFRSERFVSEDRCSEEGLSDYGNFAYGGGGVGGVDEEEEANAIRQAELELSRQIQRQQMVAEMGFDLPRVRSRQLLSMHTPIPPGAGGVEECTAEAERSRRSDSPLERGPVAKDSTLRRMGGGRAVSSFFLDMFRPAKSHAGGGRFPADAVIPSCNSSVSANNAIRAPPHQSAHEQPGHAAADTFVATPVVPSYAAPNATREGERVASEAPQSGDEMARGGAAPSDFEVVRQKNSAGVYLSGVDVNSGREDADLAGSEDRDEPTKKSHASSPTRIVQLKHLKMGAVDHLCRQPAQRSASTGFLRPDDDLHRGPSRYASTPSAMTRPRAVSDTVAMQSYSTGPTRDNSSDSSARSRNVSEVDYLEEDRSRSFSIFGMDLEEVDEGDET